MAVTSVKVSNLSFSASERDIKEFFSFSGEIEQVQLISVNERSQIAYVTFKDAQGAETAVLLSGATIVDQPITIELAPDYNPPAIAIKPSSEGIENQLAPATGSTIQKAEDVVSGMLAKGFILGKDVLGKAKAFDDKLKLTSTTTSTVSSIDQKIGFTEKLSVGTTIVNEKVKEMDDKFQVSEKTKTAIAVAGQTASNAGSAIMKNRYILTGATWVTGAFSKVAKAAGDVGQKTKEKVSAEEQRAQGGEGYSQLH
ncbi:hypothetical protein ACFE04_027532 [Oxalis oulophora]